ncbi:Helix-turn-helix domain-containing protein [Sinosporangium album]|uniref:Helix-turn-helix domain-containing protein n=1 Tax=Sinosporangium album TaxID=504805 RepID=A0A1G8C3D3_9ACTN|nr:helix-turn-helix domain-containing protein [Sinosporangium album]SDH39932.1 Helix-turn-helix domain-containing protein [Sinosporangium album]
MPRRESPITGNGPLAQFAKALRELRTSAGNPTYDQLAKEGYFSKSVLSQAAAGHRLPTLAVTLAYARACGGDRDEWQQRWEDTRRSLADVKEVEPPRRAFAVPRPPAPDLTRTVSAAAFVEHLRQLKSQAGLSLRQLVERSEGKLVRSTLSDALNRTTLPRWAVVEEIVRACGVVDQLPAWQKTWTKIHSSKRNAVSALRGAKPQGVRPRPGGPPPLPVRRPLVDVENVAHDAAVLKFALKEALQHIERLNEELERRDEMIKHLQVWASVDPAGALQSKVTEPAWRFIGHVTVDHLSGSPVTVPEEYATQLGMRPRALRPLTGPDYHMVMLIWGDRQPLFESLQPVLRHLNASPGDPLFVVVDGYRLQARITPPEGV